MSAGDDTDERFIGSKPQRVLAEDGALIQVRGDKMGGHADDLHALVIGLAVSGGPREGGQQGGVDVENPVFPVPDKVRGKNFHKSGEHHQIDPGFFQMLLQRGLRFLAIAVIN